MPSLAKGLSDWRRPSYNLCPAVASHFEAIARGEKLPDEVLAGSF